MSGRQATADVVVIGAGVLGAATAYELARRGLRTAVVERGAPGREGSGTTAGNLHVQAVHTRRPGQAVPLDSRRFLPLQKAASERWSDLEADLEADLEVRRAGGFTVAETEGQVAELKAKSAWEAAEGIPSELLYGPAAHTALPALGPTVRAVNWCPLDGYANPLLATRAYLAAAGRLGARLLPFSPVTALARHGSGWRTTIPGGTLDSAAVIDVAGPWLDAVAALAGVRLRMTPVAIQMHATVRAPVVLRHLVQHIGEGLSVKQVTAGNVLIGGGWPAGGLDLAGRSRTSTHSLAGNVAQAVRVLPSLARLRLLRMWAGPLAATPDEMPLIGEVPGERGLYVAGGTYAFTFAPLWGETLAALVAGERPPVAVADLGPHRLMRPEPPRPDPPRPDPARPEQPRSDRPDRPDTPGPAPREPVDDTSGR
ncbi:NAD(P)/FAD-dependent oxidoreductase [Streptomyces sp. CBMA29]|uniref:NAD(P)/FAD-dependent oxidoreductase n=1 Tax=Streptomyces sp. CBMA29 TaxID=1896314 RepID=UPI001CB6CF89|nr:FAD-dependent oxidoreductase [Streptomyces sp. CBMA29]MBD0736725.1 FAD-dependent oxidoreductase [Streptomyces sp. CBMA29]